MPWNAWLFKHTSQATKTLEKEAFTLGNPLFPKSLEQKVAWHRKERGHSLAGSAAAPGEDGEFWVRLHGDG